MTAKVESVLHGINYIRYITEEPRNKKNSGRVFHVGDNLLPSGPDATRIRDSILLTPARSGRVTNSAIKVNPTSVYTKDFTMEDPEKFWDNFINELDSIELHDGNGSTCVPNTNLKGYKCTIWLHEDSMSGIPHLHGAYCRIDGQGRVNKDHGTPAGATCSRVCGQETKPDDSRQGTGDEHRAGERGMHGNPAIHGKLVIG